MERIKYINELLAESDLNKLSTIDIIKRCNGWHEGHFVFYNGDHGNGWINKMAFLRYPSVMSEVGKRLAKLYDKEKDQIEVVVGPAICGTVLAYSVAVALRVPFTASYRSDTDRMIYIYDGFIPPKGTRCLFVDDLVFTGTDLRDNINYMQTEGLRVVGAAVIGYRREIELSVPFRGLTRNPFNRTSALTCGLCTNQIPITSTGVRE
ncbi:hypothetical protein A2688_03445 [Candidatus Daviesbacteria bacterium RIFCSPHIGHO2_01_FULL_38_8]|nr:MAG: hypothetical protein A2688_03445 [Candidatus Daviesbacteria bacterium RIFCSPHIGHO2_01_FULL_38_8]